MNTTNATNTINATIWYLESTKAPGLRFRILKLDKATRPDGLYVRL